MLSSLLFVRNTYGILVHQCQLMINQKLLMLYDTMLRNSFEVSELREFVNINLPNVRLLNYC